MRLIDTHTHLDLVAQQLDIDEVFENARDKDVERMVTIGASRGLESHRRALKLAEEYDWIKTTAGVHPHNAEDADEDQLEIIRDKYSEHPEVVAIGETGLDYYYDNSPRERQRRIFRECLQLSKDVDKPVVIHSREAEEDTVNILKEMDVTGGIMHCFAGSEWLARETLDMGFYLSFSGLVTFVPELLDIAADVPNDRILFETDAPFLAPEPNRGKTNQPAYVWHTAKKVAEKRDRDFEAFCEQVWENASRVFDWTD
jgi:TatD DNase family protein